MSYLCVYGRFIMKSLLIRYYNILWFIFVELKYKIIIREDDNTLTKCGLRCRV